MNMARKQATPVVGTASIAGRSDDRWMGARDAAETLGISRLALYERALSGEITSAKVAGRRVFDRDDVMRAATRTAA